MTAGDRTLEAGAPQTDRLDHGPEVNTPDRPTDGPELSVQDRPDVLDGPFTTRQLLRIDEALRLADEGTGLVFSVFVGGLDEPVREHAQHLHAQLADPARGVMIAVSPNQRVLEIVTGSEARKRIPDRDVKLAALSMVAAFGGGDLAGGIVSGLDQLASRAGKHA